MEGGIAARLAGRLTTRQLEALAEHAQREQAAVLSADRAASIRLSGEFHVLLAELCGNDELTRLLNLPQNAKSPQTGIFMGVKKSVDR